MNLWIPKFWMLWICKSFQFHIDRLNGTQLSTKAHIMKLENQVYSVLLDAILLGHDDWVLSVAWQPRSSMEFRF